MVMGHILLGTTTANDCAWMRLADFVGIEMEGAKSCVTNLQISNEQVAGSCNGDC